MLALITAKYTNPLQKSFTLRLKSQSLKALLFEKGSKIIKFIPFLGFKPNSWGLSLELLFSLMREKANFPPFPHFLPWFSVARPAHGCNLSSYSVSFPDFCMFFLWSPISWTPWEKKGSWNFWQSPLPSPLRPVCHPAQTDIYFIKVMHGYRVFRIPRGKYMENLYVCVNLIVRLM